MYDVLIVGAGLAGSTLARTIGEKYKVLLVDKEHLVRIEPGNPIRVYLHGDNRPETLESRVLVGANGAASAVRRQLFTSDATPHSYLAIQEWFPTTEIMPYFSVIFEPAITDFYSWIIPKKNYLTMGAALPPGKICPA